MTSDSYFEGGSDAGISSAAAHGKLPDQPTTILVADDEHLVASGIVANLRDLGYHAIGPASDGEEAVSLCQATRPHMALLDIRMPKLDGLEAAAQIFQKFSIPAMILSAYSDPEFVDRATHTGIFGYLLKPITQDQLRVAISIAWSRYLETAGQSTEIVNLKERLENRKTIEKAKWMIVKRKSVEEPEAMRLLQRQARNNRRSLVDVAKSILENADLFEAVTNGE
jgi:response regulator NasT